MSEENKTTENSPKKKSKFFSFFNKGEKKTVEVKPGAEPKIVKEESAKEEVVEESVATEVLEKETETPEATEVETPEVVDETPKGPSFTSRLLKRMGASVWGFIKGFHPKKFLEVFIPNKSISTQIMFVVVALQVIAAGIYWTTNTSELLPTPGEIWDAFVRMSTDGEGLIGEMWVSMKLCLDAVVKTIIISLIICYATVLPVFKPLAFVVTKFRFLTLVGLSFIFTLATDDGYNLKIWLLTFGMTVFFVTSMMRVLKDITQNELNHARTLGMSEWRVVWEVVVLAKVDKVFDIIRQNFAIAWMMLTLVEGLSRADGGIGIMLINQNKYLHLDSVFAIQFLILFVGIGMDYMFGVAKRIACPYAHLTKGFK
jgi:NitT/TauT family transport system permease protein